MKFDSKYMSLMLFFMMDISNEVTLGDSLITLMGRLKTDSGMDCLFFVSE